MKKRTLVLLMALCLVLSLGTGALAAEEGDGMLWFTTEDGQTEFTSETPAAVTMTVTVPEDGTYLITSWIDGVEDFSVTSENEALIALIDDGWFDLLYNEPVELTAGEYVLTAENVTYVSVSLFHPDTTGLPDDIPPAAERVDAAFRFSDGDRSSSYFYTEEPASVTMTATVEQDGLYFVDAFVAGNDSLSLTADSDAFAFLSQLPLEDIVFGVSKRALVELTAGEYTIQIENATSCHVEMGLTHPLDAVDGVIGEGLYVCQLDEPMTVNYTVIGVGAGADIYAGPADSLSEAGLIHAIDENSDQKVLNFEPGMVVIDFEGGYVTSALVGSTEGVHDAGTGSLAAESEPIWIMESYANLSDGTILGTTATVPADGYYLFAADPVPLNEGAPVGFTTDLPIQMESDVVPDWTFSEDEGIYKMRAVLELTAGDYTLDESNAYGSDILAEFTPGYMVDSLAGTFAQGGVYMCELSEPVTVTFTMDAGDVEGIVFYGGSVGELLQPLTPAADGGTLTVEFPAGIAVIDVSSYSVRGPVTGTVN